MSDFDQLHHAPIQTGLCAPERLNRATQLVDSQLNAAAGLSEHFRAGGQFVRAADPRGRFAQTARRVEHDAPCVLPIGRYGKRPMCRAGHAHQEHLRHLSRGTMNNVDLLQRWVGWPTISRIALGRSKQRLKRTG